MITTCPNGDQYVAVSTVVSPVTHTAETVVNAAVSTGGRVGPGVEYGSDSRMVPTTTTAKNAAGTTRAGCMSPFQIHLTRQPLPCCRQSRGQPPTVALTGTAQRSARL